ncbi:olefin beta-lactone synthetase [Parashewanella tropica]|uniref:olefin beta-lactone synthetase n=1 Tax=Parashewanella tropica TaxID=2547970 RepID=UPI00105A4642|nr:fatty acid CoA ligase family protein [Parashewanella tropica]
MNLCRHLKLAAVEQPEALAVAVQQHRKGEYHYQELNFSQLHQKSDHIANALTEFGITRGMKAVLMVTPSLEFFQLTFALFKAGVIPVIVDPGMGLKNLKQCFAEAEPDAFIGIEKAHVARKLLGWAKRTVKHSINVDIPIANPKLSGVKSLLTSSTNLSSLLAKSRADRTFEMAELDADEMCAILFTSGSTGIPKGVVYSHKMFEAQIQALKNDYGIEYGERDLATFPLFSLFGPALGMASIVPDMDASKPITAEPKHLFKAVEDYQCSNMFVNPALVNKLGAAGESLNQKLPSVRRVISAGAPVTIEAIQRFSKMLNDGIPVLNSYGATESLPISMLASDELFETQELTNNGAGICVGRPISGMQIKIIDITEQDINGLAQADELGVDQVGEIIVTADVVSQSYYQRQAATQASKIQDGEKIWHRMGDLGYLDVDGKLWMCGRKAHRVDAENKRYYSIPCERIFNTHPSVKLSALVGVRLAGKVTPLVCLELNEEQGCHNSKVIYAELTQLAEQHSQTQGIMDFLSHPEFPVDVRHNAKIFREKLAIWAQKKVG